ncbi:hypothetical protein [Microvirga aerophila]|uniref:Uncharacterized protein n=1 Tax=Microvirga aerophila TaxID=670291 RepID=A0A512C2Z2_9HYPH|nr:hypothetical protein [Microvirga aerophila]GEO18561.1 hypothetical protein MAE02_62570 [Microvirga aerophila]
MISRRSFLLGLGSLVTASFAARAQAYALAEGGPLLLDPGPVEKMLHLYEGLDPVNSEWGSKWRVSLGLWQQDPPDPPTWREHLRQQGYHFDSPDDLDRIWRERCVAPEELDAPLPEQSWWCVWEFDESPQAKAYTLLKELGLACRLNRSDKKAGRITFVEWGYHPGSSKRFVELQDDLTVSFLQARLIERKLPIRLVIDD